MNSTMNSQTPLAETAERLAEASPIRYLGLLAGVENFTQDMADHRQRVRDGHRAMARAAGMEDVVGQDASEDAMRDVTIAGDTTQTHHHHYSAPPVAATPATPVAPVAVAPQPAAPVVGGAATDPEPSMISRTLPVLAGTLIGGALALAGPMLLDWWNSPADSSYEVLFYDRNGNLIDVPHISQRPTGDKP